jgi:Na+/H+ antiporter NhaD/arsenite permease-like protein
MDTSILALIIFILTYIGIIFTRLPKVNLSRPSAAFTGAVLMVVCGVISANDAIKAIDFNTITLLLGMMIIISTLKLEGFFSLIAAKTISLAKTRTKLLILIVFITGFASAFLVNDAVVLMFTPIIITICKRSNLDSIPFLIAEILSANIGSVMTMTGNPQNMLIGINSGISYSNFLIHLLPISLLGMLLVILFVKLFYKKTFNDTTPLVFSHSFRYSLKKMKVSLGVFVLVILGFFFGKMFSLSIPIIALCGAALILLFAKPKPDEIMQNVDWNLLLFFASLFIVVAAIKNVGLLDGILRIKLENNMVGILSIHGLSLFLSQIISNVPFTVLMLPLMKVTNSSILWLSLASASTLAGNATIFGAMANLIVIQQAEKEDIKITFASFFKIGIITTLATFLISIFFMMLY